MGLELQASTGQWCSRSGKFNRSLESITELFQDRCRETVKYVCLGKQLIDGQRYRGGQRGTSNSRGIRGQGATRQDGRGETDIVWVQDDIFLTKYLFIVTSRYIS
jgi:hypothetical protein